MTYLQETLNNLKTNESVIIKHIHPVDKFDTPLTVLKVEDGHFYCANSELSFTRENSELTTIKLLDDGFTVIN